MGEIVLSWVGTIFIGLILLAICAASLAFLIEKIHEFYNSWVRSIRGDIVRRVGINIESCAWWFSESEETMELIKILGNDLSRTGNAYIDPNYIRDKWRDKLKGNI